MHTRTHARASIDRRHSSFNALRRSASLDVSRFVNVTIAHRAGKAICAENTLIAVEESIVRRVKGVEIDVQLSKDGHAVVIHNGLRCQTCCSFRSRRPLSRFFFFVFFLSFGLTTTIK